MMNRWMSVCVLAWMAALPACDGAEQNPQLREAASATADGNPLATIERPAPAETRFVGQVEEVKHAGSYTYLRVKCERDAAQRWVVTMGHGADVGDHVAVHNFGTKRDFRSKRLKRTFSELVFGIVRASNERRGA